MITKYKNHKVEVEFGHGDIRIRGIEKDGEGIVALDQMEKPREVGEYEDSLYAIEDVLSADVLLKFKNIKSLDVFIGQLQTLKSILKERETEENNGI